MGRHRAGKIGTHPIFLDFLRRESLNALGVHKDKLANEVSLIYEDEESLVLFFGSSEFFVGKSTHFLDFFNKRCQDFKTKIFVIFNSISPALNNTNFII